MSVHLENKRPKRSEETCITKRQKTEPTQSTLQSYFKKEPSNSQDIQNNAAFDTCPICHTSLNEGLIVEAELHINSCLDSVTSTDGKDINTKAADQPNLIKSWATLFSTATHTIRGIWSSPKDDKAPGLLETESSWWFGEQKKGCQVPYYKRLAGTTMVVDAFSFGDIPGCEGYFLSHFHADHYTGLDRNWTHGPIYCSEVTARLVKRKLGVTEDFIYALPLDEPCLLPGMDQLFVTLIDANHCPGAVIFLVTVGKLRYLHTGDFRACPKICLHPLLKEPIDIVYLDTTYLDPKYSFPSQDSCIQSACQLAKRHSTRYSDPLLEEGKSIISASNACQQEHRLLIVVGTYSLGKERIFIEIAKALNSKIFVTEQKRHMLDCFHDSELNAMLTDEQKEAQVHVIPIGHLVPNNLEAYLSSLEPHFSQMIALKPTGWTFQASSDPKTKSQQEKRSLETIIKARPPDLVATSLKPFYDTSRLKMYDIPYSEHSSFRELAMFIASLDIRRIVPTVNVHSQENRSRMSKLFEEWNRDKKKLIKANGGSIKIVDYPSINYW